MKRITIIGGGASGTLLAVNLMKNVSRRPVEINLIESRRRVGRGVAFGTKRDSHLLNVPAAKMGAFPDDVEDFKKWLADKGHAYQPNDFVPRRLYGEYLRELFERSADEIGTEAKLNLIDDEAVDMSVNPASAEVIIKSGEIVQSDSVILAFGNFKPPHPSVLDLEFTSSARYYQDPWNSKLYNDVKPDDSIFIVGTGLSMVDVALHFQEHGHRGKITAISTRGLLPTVHKLGYTYPSFSEDLKSLNRVTDMLKIVRVHIKKAESNGSDWRAVIDSLRPATQDLWLNLPLAEKRYFMQHLSRYWNVARHRMPGPAADILLDMCEKGSLEILKGRLKAINVGNEGKFEIAYSNIDVKHRLFADCLVNCIGSEANFSKVDSLFVKNLLERGHVRNDQLSFGIDASPDGRVVNKHGDYSAVVFTLGTALKGVLWESTAVPEIRTQARDLALRLLAD